jgi:hypothetical protein
MAAGLRELHSILAAGRKGQLFYGVSVAPVVQAGCAGVESRRYTYNIANFLDEKAITGSSAKQIMNSTKAAKFRPPKMSRRSHRLTVHLLVLVYCEHYNQSQVRSHTPAASKRKNGRKHVMQRAPAQNAGT